MQLVEQHVIRKGDARYEMLDRQEMTISRRKNGSWIGQYFQQRKRIRVSLGKEDPREKYPKVKK